jgi:hypothetical protein
MMEASVTKTAVILIFAAAWLLGVSVSANAAPLVAPCTQTTTTAIECDPVNTANPLPVSPNSYPAGATAITGNGTGTTGAVVGTLAAAAAKLTYICGFAVSALGGTAAVGPITIAGLVGSSMVYYFASAAAGAQLTQAFTPCIPSSAVNTAITTTTTADGTASNVAVNSWGYQK